MIKIGHNGGPQIDSGWIAIARSMREHPIVGFHLFAKPMDRNRGAMQPALAWLDLLFECRYEEGYVVNGGRKMKIEPGQMVGAVSWLAARWNWTPMAVRVYLDKLTAEGMISRMVPGSPNKYSKHHGKVSTIITVCNYWKYQLGWKDREQTKQQTNNKQTTNEQQQYKDNNLTIEQKDISICAPDVAPTLEEIAGLNGSTTEIVEHIAKRINPDDPNIIAVHTAIKALVQQPPVEIPAPAKPKGKPANKPTQDYARRLNPNWVLTRPLGQWAIDFYVVDVDSVKDEGRKFKDHWLSSASKTAKKLDWDAAWRTWMGNAAQRNGWRRRLKPSPDDVPLSANADLAALRQRRVQVDRDRKG